MRPTGTLMWSGLAALVALGCAAPPGPAPTPPAASPVPDPEVDLAIARDLLRRADTFKTSGVGEAGARPRESEALCLLVAAGDAAGLRRLAAEATPAGQLFALAGLARVDSATYAELLPAFRTRTDEVGYFFYCELGGMPVRELVRELEETALLDGVIDSGPWRGVSGLEDRGAFIARLGDADPWVRRAAARALGKLGPWARPALEPLAAALRDDPSPHVRVAAARAMRGLGDDAGAAAALRATLLESEAPLEARIAAFDALRAVEPEGELRRALGILLPLALVDPARRVWRWAYDELWDLVPADGLAFPFDARFHTARARNEVVALECLEHLADLEPGDAVIAATRSWLDHPDPVVRHDAATRLLARGPDGRSALEAERGRLDATTPRGIELAAWLAPETAPASLLAALSPERPRSERLAAAHLAAGCETPGAWEALGRLLAGGDPAVAHAARDLLGGGALSDELSASLHAQLAGPDVFARVVAADALVATGELFPEARSALIEGLGSTDDAVRRRATAALATHDEAAVEHLDLLAEVDPWTQLELALPRAKDDEAVQAGDPQAAQAQQVLVQLTRSDDQELRRAAAAGLPWTAGANFPELLDHPDPVVRFEAAFGLSGDTPRQDLAVIFCEVMDALPGDDEQEAALEQLDLEDEGSPEQREAVVAALRRLLDDPRWGEQATTVLGSVLGQPAALLEARSPRAVAQLVAESEYWAEDLGRDRAEAALEARLAIEQDPRLRYLLEDALANVRSSIAPGR